MANIQIFDSAQHPHTGLSAEQAAHLSSEFAADVDWLNAEGAQIERFNQATQAAAFDANPVVKDLITRSGDEALPIILVNGELALSGRYPNRTELSNWARAKKLVVLNAGSSDCCSGGMCD